MEPDVGPREDVFAQIGQAEFRVYSSLPQQTAGPLYLIMEACEGVPVSGPLPLVSVSTARAKVDSAQYSINGRVDL